MASSFTESAKGLAKNPLGIIALFISFVYALACLVIGISTKNLTTYERQPLIWYVILFPIITLACFMYLVVNHPEKLYSPGDYKNEDNFVSTIGAGKRKQFSAAENNINQEKTEDIEDIMDNLLKYSSVMGTFAMYAAYLADKHSKTFTLEVLQARCDIMNASYVHGFYVALSCVGAVRFTTISEPFAVSYIDPKIEANITNKIYALLGEHEESKNYLQLQIENLELAFSDVSSRNES